MRFTLLLLCFWFSSVPAILGQTSEAAAGLRKNSRLWRISLVTLATANALDVHSSWGKRELNRVLVNDRATFGGRALAMKVAFQGSMIGVQYLFFRGRPNRTLTRACSIINFGSASVTAATAVRNYGIPRPAR